MARNNRAGLCSARHVHVPAAGVLTEYERPAVSGFLPRARRATGHGLKDQKLPSLLLGRITSFKDRYNQLSAEKAESGVPAVLCALGPRGQLWPRLCHTRAHTHHETGKERR